MTKVMIHFGSGMRPGGWGTHQEPGGGKKRETEAGEVGSPSPIRAQRSAHSHSHPVPSQPPAPPRLGHLGDCPRAIHLSGSLPHLSPQFLVPENSGSPLPQA